MASYAGFSESSPQSFPQTSDVPGHATGKRRLLIIYIHGFCGSEDSFGQFPSHVHSFLKQALCDTHVVYSKIYPQYETRNAMDIAVEKFSRWLQPHENSQTDVILVGHSLGGILAAQAALLKKSLYSTYQSRSSLVGTISLDCPFLGLNPGIIIPGIMSLFRPNIQVKANAQDGGSDMLESRYSSSSRLLLFDPPTSDMDTCFNPPFFNDNEVWPISRPSESKVVQSVCIDGLWGWLLETIDFCLSHWAYGRCLRRPWALRLRYHELRALEGSNQFPPTYEKRVTRAGDLGRRSGIRFLNFFTASTRQQPCHRSKVSSLGHLDVDKEQFFEQAGKDHRIGRFSSEPDFDSWSTEVEGKGHCQQSATDGLCLQERTTVVTSKITDDRERLYQVANISHSFSALLSGLVEFFWRLLSLFQCGPDSRWNCAEGLRAAREGEVDRKGAVKPDEGRTFCILPPEADPSWVRISMEGMDEVGAHCNLFVDDGPHYDILVLRMGKEIIQWVHNCNSS
ncbi:uncharacterized protein B0J16DRAFT_400036 [Fusarium flagelliforme]|uniref:Reticulocyte-binding protein 2 a-like protein n=1 Tax=Fusarium flagelliforme TaxID=2675880 RepID=A0A395M645_9HYPO|nr:uncharacterized protein B0J16DRAFT_400036 [Fusarium flagelliforme]KAH7186144.1 hypothetical protein B0J16DRAFT_400036 [Fusarium flagelliforme]RFN43318.1 reticulocyte-binding protein 2 a-like protein [Fusarium flagelliforme]